MGRKKNIDIANESNKATKSKTKSKPKSNTPKHSIEQELFVMWICKEYELSYTPNYLFDIIAEIEKGEYKNLTKPVPFDDLQDMWQRKMPYLKKTHFRNSCMGKEMQDVEWIKYDLAIVLSKYDDYLEWKSKQLLAETAVNNKPLDDINYSHIQENISPKEVLDISDIIDEI